MRLLLAMLLLTFSTKVHQAHDWDVKLDCIDMTHKNPMPLPGSIQTFVAIEYKWSDAQQKGIEGRNFVCFAAK
jgi:hypothetical protein